MLSKIRKRLFDILEKTDRKDAATVVDDVLLLGLVLLNTIAVVLETVDSIYEPHKDLFDAFELISIVIFTAEYLLRVWVCVEDARFSNPLAGRLKYMLKPLALVDLIAFLPFYLPFMVRFDLRFVRAVRLFRLLRIFKLTRYFEGMRTLGKVVKGKREELLITLAVVCLILFFASTLIYFVERDTQPEAFSSIPKALWWGVETLTTVGYGDIFPLTPAGKIIAAFVALLGIGLFALPAGILASGFAEELQKRKQRGVCPHCGKEI